MVDLNHKTAVIVKTTVPPTMVAGEGAMTETTATIIMRALAIAGAVVMGTMSVAAAMAAVTEVVAAAMAVTAAEAQTLAATEVAVGATEAQVEVTEDLEEGVTEEATIGTVGVEMEDMGKHFIILLCIAF